LERLGRVYRFRWGIRSRPANLLPSGQGGDAYVPAGDTISVYTGPNATGTLLYSQAVTGTAPDLPVVVPNNNAFNTGVYPFMQIPIYLPYSPSGTGTMFLTPERGTGKPFTAQRQSALAEAT